MLQAEDKFHGWPLLHYDVTRRVRLVLEFNGRDHG